jgi:altronate dehydratase small subunit
MTAECFQIDRQDNVATLLQDAPESAEIVVRGEAGRTSLKALQSIRTGHKVALRHIEAGEHIIKYGHAIGEATQTIREGEWVHLHNCRSLYDARSSSLDIESGARKETPYV